MQTDNDNNAQPQSEDHERLVLMKARIVKIAAVELQIKKLNTVLGSMAVSERPRQLSLLKQARKYTDTIMAGAPTGLRPAMNVIANEIQSLHEGLTARVVKPKDLVLISGVRTLKTIEELRTKLQSAINRTEARLGINATQDPASQLLLRNKEISGQIPRLGDKDYAVIRAPLAFTFGAPNGKHSSVGYVDTARLTNLGFKVENLDGYTILHKQMLVGVSHESLVHSRQEVKDADGNVTGTNVTMEKMHDSVLKYTKGKHVRVSVARPKTLLDVAREVITLISSKTNVPYELVSQVGARYNDGIWFWAMATRDMTRMATAFPGGHLKVPHWGPAFPVEEKAKPEPKNV